VVLGFSGRRPRRGSSGWPLAVRDQLDLAVSQPVDRADDPVLALIDRGAVYRLTDGKVELVADGKRPTT
ncbi:hypothetical protein, partial [Bradyrhizobium sp.]|uniref:hypothetical protein n=1 Tax=Bradyrhizobium sp. TaxID=376 RepID=UPI00391C7089